MNNIAKFQAALNNSHKLFDKLKHNAPDWWRCVVNCDKVYIDVRKDNTINIYYQGASLAKIEFQKGGIKATCHPKYLYGDDVAGFYKNGHAIYQPCEEELRTLADKGSRLLKNAQQFYTNKDDKESKNPEDKAEKKLQGEIVCKNRELYIDSEFAHRYQEGLRHTIRIDLVRVKDNKIQFVELKRIQDNRLLHKKDSKKPPEIITQIKEYRQFLTENKAALLDYYKRLITIKRELGLPTPNVDINSLNIDIEPHLEIHNLYVKDSKQREDRIKEIRDLLDTKVKYEIISHKTTDANNDPDHP